LGVSRQAINGIKKGGGFNDETAKIISKVTKRELAEVLLIREIQVVNDPIIKKAWEIISQRSGIAAALLLLCLSTPFNDAKATQVEVNNIHYAKYSIKHTHMIIHDEFEKNIFQNCQCWIIA